MVLFRWKVAYCIASLLLVIPLVYAQENRALIIAIDNYPPENGWSKIHSSNDLRLIVPILEESGYRVENICILKNEQATRKAIVAEMENLVRVVEKGDYIYIHFSCHGQQMADDNGDEPDGLDEAMIPYDAQRRYIEGVYEGENHLRDDLLGEFFNAIRYKAGGEGNLIVVFDACHSGTADREVEEDVYIRGTSYIFAPKNFKKSSVVSANAIFKPVYQEGMAHITVISACGADERNYEYRDAISGEYYGSLTYAFFQTVYTFEKGNSNIDFFNRVCSKMVEISSGRRRVQIPFIETTNNDGVFKMAVNE